MRSEEIMNRLEEEYPLGSAEEWDNPGLLVGRRNREVKRVFIALDATEETISQAVDFGADMMITHHPLLFHSVKQINDDTFIGRRILTLIENDITYYAMHTNFDVIGMAQINEKQLGLENTKVLDVTGDNQGVDEGIGRVGDLPHSMTLEDAAAYVRKCLGLSTVRCYGLSDEEENKNPDDKIRVSRCAVCGGSGKSVVDKAIAENADILVTGDIDYHTAIDALAQGLYIIDAGHYGTEYCFIDYMVKKMQRLFPEVETRGAKVQQPYMIV
ncbi:MAG: Nif3-like dinuclear metal center hexameric protein [Eubacteriales bacterium]|jgi:dinuclear metal center YbgI/SA1388 family protein